MQENISDIEYLFCWKTINPDYKPYIYMYFLFIRRYDRLCVKCLLKLRVHRTIIKFYAFVSSLSLFNSFTLIMDIKSVGKFAIFSVHWMALSRLVLDQWNNKSLNKRRSLISQTPLSNAGIRFCFATTCETFCWLFQRPTAVLEW